MSGDLPKAKLGRTGLEVTRLGYGAMEIRGEPRGRQVTPEQADQLLNAVLDAGINYIDTSIDYGRSEEFIGEYISGRRSEYYLATKCGCLVGGAPGQRGHVFTRENIVAGVNQSLARMKTEYLDVVQFHSGPSKDTLELHGAIETLLDLRTEGKIRHLGMSSSLPNLADHVAMGVFDVLQIPYSGLQRENESWIAKAATAGIGTVIRGGVAKGEQLGKSGKAALWQRFEDAKLDELREEDESRTSFLLRFTLAHPGMATTIVGSQNAEHITENARTALRGPLAPDVHSEAKSRLGLAGE